MMGTKPTTVFGDRGSAIQDGQDVAMSPVVRWGKQDSGGRVDRLKDYLVRGTVVAPRLTDIVGAVAPAACQRTNTFTGKNGALRPGPLKDSSGARWEFRPTWGSVTPAPAGRATGGGPTKGGKRPSSSSWFGRIWVPSLGRPRLNHAGRERDRRRVHPGP